MKFDWRKHDNDAPESTYVRLALPGDVLKFPRDNRYWQVESVKLVNNNSFARVKFYGRTTPVVIGWNDRAKLWFRFANRDNVGPLEQSSRVGV